MIVWLQWESTRLNKERNVNLDVGNRMDKYQRLSVE